MYSVLGECPIDKGKGNNSLYFVIEAGTAMFIFTMILLNHYGSSQAETGFENTCFQTWI